MSVESSGAICQAKYPIGVQLHVHSDYVVTSHINIHTSLVINLQLTKSRVIELPGVSTQLASPGCVVSKAEFALLAINIYL